MQLGQYPAPRLSIAHLSDVHLLAGYPAGVVEQLALLGPDDLREELSPKCSDFNVVNEDHSPR